MEGRPNRGRGGGWKRGGRGGNDGDKCGSDHRGRGRGGHHRGRGRKDYHRGRGRGGDANAAEFQHWNQVEGDAPEEAHSIVFSRRKLESNWDRYEDSEKQEIPDNMPTIRGTDYHVLLGSAGDCFTQFRFSEEKDWETDTSSSTQMSTLFVDLPALAQVLEQVPLHQRLNLEAELVQVSTPVNSPTTTLASKQETAKLPSLTPSAVPSKDPSTKTLGFVASSDLQAPSSVVTASADELDDELDQLLTLAKPLNPVSGDQSVNVESAVVMKDCDTVTEVQTEEKMEEPKDNITAPPESASVKQEMTEEDLEDWLDSMIS
ncbi:cell death regulator Aven [Syngnathus acus]|uniref:cell death regulator Aven n=1 Tax=Syngnathus acus TaxID=161584 RepID=UPI0018864C71|nr:cell death regulator Aven [Syngnathus acus]XP_037100575.1 cell death regulator Aven [Syngnathus acus]XP_037100576.1 cell death regulator Aven [Syngnathus acus]